MITAEIEVDPSSSGIQPQEDPISNEHVAAEIRRVADQLIEKLNKGDRSMKEGLIKFTDRVNTLPTPRLISALHSFGTTSGHSSLKTTATSILKRAKKRMIGVQPDAIKRRKVNSLSQ